jgi:hypothetical protein
MYNFLTKLALRSVSFVLIEKFFFSLFQLKMELSSSLTSVGLGDVEGFGGLLGISLDQPHALEALGTKRRR